MKPIAITLGDPAGIGPEITAKLLTNLEKEDVVIFGAKSAAEPYFSTQKWNFVDFPTSEKVIAGVSNPSHAQSVKSSIVEAVAAIQNGNCSSLLTMPISKSNMQNGCDFPFPGHTEFLAHLDKKSFSVMLLMAENILSVVPATIHIPLKDVSKSLTKPHLYQVISMVYSELKFYLKREPIIAVTGLNPHAGEDGLIGDEEELIIKPIIKELQNQNIHITGPFPADTIFHKPAREKYDVIIGMYHDQVLIPLKTLAFDLGVNVTLGLSFLRASPDHGTAFDIAGKNIANPSSAKAAYNLLKTWGQNAR